MTPAPFRFWIETDTAPTRFWNGRALSPEYPDAKRFRTRGEAYTALRKARERLGVPLAIRDRLETEAT